VGLGFRSQFTIRFATLVLFQNCFVRRARDFFLIRAYLGNRGFTLVLCIFKELFAIITAIFTNIRLKIIFNRVSEHGRFTKVYLKRN